MNKNFWPDLNSQIFKLTPLHPREENHPEMVNIARVFTFRSSHQHHCHSFRFSLEFSFFSLVSSTSSTCLAIMNSYMKTKTKLYSINCFIFNEKTIQLLTVSCSFRKTTMNLQPTTPATAPVEDMAAPQNQIPSSHAKYGGRFEKKKGLRLPEGCLSHSPFCRDEKLLGFIFGLQLSENHLFQWTFRVGNHRILKNRQSWEKNQLEKNQDVRPVIGFCFGPWRQSVLKKCQVWFPNMFCH